MPEKPIKQRLEVDYDDKGMKKSIEDEHALKRGVEQAGDQAERSTKQHNGYFKALGKIKSSIVGLVSGFASFAVLTSFIRANTEELNRNAAAANKVKEAQLDLQFLSQGYNPQELAAVKAAAEIKGGSNAQVSAIGAFADLKSKTASMSDQQRIELFQQLVETSLTTTSSLGELVPLFAKGSQFVSDPNRLQAIIRETQNLSPAAKPTVLAKEFPEAFTVGTSAGLIPEQIAGLLVGALNISEETGGTSLRNILVKLSGGVTPEGQRVLDKSGAAPGGGILNQLDALRKANLSTADLVNVFGSESITVIQGLLKQNEYGSNIHSILKASQGGRDLTQEAIKTIFAKDEQQRLRLQTAQSEARVEGLRAADVNAQRAELVGNLIDEQGLKQHRAPYMRWLDRFMYEQGVGLGLSPESSAFANLPGDIYTGAMEQLNKGPSINVTTIGQVYNTVNPDGTNHQTEPSRRSDLP